MPADSARYIICVAPLNLCNLPCTCTRTRIVSYTNLRFACTQQKISPAEVAGTPASTLGDQARGGASTRTMSTDDSFSDSLASQHRGL